MATERPYANLTDAELRTEVLERPDGRLPPPNEARALLDEWIRRRVGRGSSEKLTSRGADRLFGWRPLNADLEPDASMKGSGALTLAEQAAPV